MKLKRASIVDAGGKMILGASYGSIEDIEILWTLIALVGLFFALFNLRESLRDRKSIKSLNIVNGRAKIAKTGLKSEIARVIKQLIFLTIGAFALYLPGVDYSTLPWKVVVINISIRWGLIIASFLTTYQSYLFYKLRRDLLGD